jgi:hypothetical protein
MHGKAKQTHGYLLLTLRAHNEPADKELHLVTRFFVTVYFVITNSWIKGAIPTEKPTESFLRAAVAL